MSSLLQDLLNIEYPFLFLITVGVSIIVVMCSVFFMDKTFREKEQHKKEVKMSPNDEDEAISSGEDLSGSEKSGNDQDSEEKKCEELEDVGGAGDEEEVACLMGRLRSARLKEIEEALTEDQKKSEKEMEQEQLKAIFDLLRKQESDLAMNPMDEMDLKEQLSMYR